MKKTLLTVLLCGAGSAAFGQGFAIFNNVVRNTTPSINAPIYLYQVGGFKLDSAVNSLWRAALLGGPTTSTPAFVNGSLGFSSVGHDTAGNLGLTHYVNDATRTWVGFRSGTSTVLGAGVVDVGAESTYVIPGVDFGQQAMLQVVAWQGNFTDWYSAFAAAELGDGGVKIGASNPVTVTLESSPTDTAYPYLWGLQPFEIGIPEPSSAALGGLGAAMWLAGRRRR
jgi:hypothetical protein